MKIKKSELVKAMSVVSPAISTRSIMEQTSHFIFNDNIICGYNDSICILHPFTSGLKFSIPAKEFSEIINSIKDDEVEISIKDGKIKIESNHINHIRSSLSMYSDESADIIDLIDELDIPDRWSNLPLNFITGVYHCLFAASKDITQPVISNIGIDGRYILATDDVRISRFKILPPKMPPFLLPLASAIELTKIEMKYFHLAHNWVYFKTEHGTIFCSRIVKEQFPDTNNLFDVEGTEIKFPQGMIETVDLATILADGERDIDKTIKVKIKEDKITCRGEKELGWIESDLKTKTDIDGEINLIVNPVFFAQILSETTTMIYSENQVKFISKDFEHVLCLAINEAPEN